MRRRLPGWDNAIIIISHQDDGGVTLHSLKFGLLRKHHIPRPGALPSVAPRDVSTVLSATPQHYTVRKASAERHLGDKARVNLGSS
jgi:hypothetical protein